VGYKVDGLEVSLVPGDVAGGPVAYADVEDLAATCATLPMAAPRAQRPTSGRIRSAGVHARHANGNPIGLHGR
jgi:hypothetical protein